MGFREKGSAAGVVLMACLVVSSGQAAERSAYQSELQQRWLDEIKPQKRAKHITAALELAEKTLAYVQKSRKLPRYEAYFKRLEALWKGGRVKPTEYDKFYVGIRRFRRATLFSHPAMNFDKILVNRNPPTLYSHNGDQHLGRHSRVGPGLTMLTNWKTDLKAVAILKDKLPAGATRNPDLHYDAERVVFAFCDHTRTKDAKARRYFLYEAALDGSWVRQLTGTKRDRFETRKGRATAMIEDNDPCYLPNDDLVFISSRCQSFGRCHGGRYNPAWVLFRSDKNGDKIRQISWNNENEYEPSVLNDGRIVFTRWEYTNRHEMFFHMLWWCRPDGTSISHFFGNDMAHPMEMVETTALPGSGKVVTTAQGHHSYNTGTIVVLDPDKGENGEEFIQRITPETPYSETRGWPNPHYSHACPLNEDLFLVSRANHPVHQQGKRPPHNNRAVYLIDTLGGREFIYEDPDVASFSPIAVRKRKRPPMLPSALPKKPPEYGTIFVQNVNLTRNDPEGIIKPGMIKAIRVNAIGVQPRAQRMSISQGCPNDIPKKVLGTAPINKYGSAFVKVPANTALQVQSLDENGMAVLTEKSFFYVMPGENRSCIGCHEEVGAAPDVQAVAHMSRLAPADLKPAAGPQYPGGMSFMRTVQPVLDRYCIGCHGLGDSKNAKANKVNLVHDGRMTWPQSYRQLVARGDHRVGDKGYMQGRGEAFNFSRPRRFYAYRNKVSHMLLKNHGKVNMDKDSYMRIIEWLDLNAQCYGDMFPNKIEERRIDGRGMTARREFAKTVVGERMAGQPERALINPAQPGESRILMAPLARAAGGWGQVTRWKSKNDPGYRKMAELVEKCIVRKKNENDRGWDPTLAMGAGEGWVMDVRKRFMQELGITATK
jgi:hypothetical protein